MDAVCSFALPFVQFWEGILATVWCPFTWFGIAAPDLTGLLGPILGCTGW
jgi:hypothetical protein